MNKLSVKKGDLVEVIAGKEKGKRGTIERVIPATNRVVITGLNIVKRHVKPSKNAPKGGIIEKPASLHRSNVMPVCPETQKPTRVRMVTTGETKYRSSQFGDISLDNR